MKGRSPLRKNLAEQLEKKYGSTPESASPVSEAAVAEPGIDDSRATRTSGSNGENGGSSSNKFIRLIRKGTAVLISPSGKEKGNKEAVSPAASYVTATPNPDSLSPEKKFRSDHEVCDKRGGV